MEAEPTGAGLVIVGLILIAFLVFVVAVFVGIVMLVRRAIRRRGDKPTQHSEA